VSRSTLTVPAAGVSSSLEVAMIRLRRTTSTTDLATPAPSGLMIHGYGGCKEEMLGLGIHLCETVASEVVLIDLPGHGGSNGEFSADSVFRAMRHVDEVYPTLFAIGHSIGARICLGASSAAMIAGICPPLRPDILEGNKEVARSLRQRRVKESAPYYGLTEILERFGESIGTPRPVFLVRASSDLVTVRDALHAWANLPEVTDGGIIRGVNHVDILSSPQLAEIVSVWLRDSLDAGNH